MEFRKVGGKYGPYEKGSYKDTYGKIIMTYASYDLNQDESGGGELTIKDNRGHIIFHCDDGSFEDKLYYLEEEVKKLRALKMALSELKRTSIKKLNKICREGT